jgi:hypothetical protein
MWLPGDLWFNQMLLLACLEEEDEDDNNERFYNQLNGEGHRRRDRHLPRAVVSFVLIGATVVGGRG